MNIIQLFIIYFNIYNKKLYIKLYKPKDSKTPLSYFFLKNVRLHLPHKYAIIQISIQTCRQYKTTYAVDWLHVKIQTNIKR